MKNKQANWSISKLSLESGLYQSDGAVAILADGERIALVDCQTKFKRGEGYKAKCPIRDANARLIAAAPELLAAAHNVDVLYAEMQIAMKHLVNTPAWDVVTNAVWQARAAIAKAERV
jgi:hypothetical protein